MSTQFYNTTADHSSDATFRAWGSAVSSALIAVGTASGCLQQTTDTGQINWTTVTRPGTNTAGGYEIYKFTDSLSGSAPIYLKLEYGTGSSATFPQMWITVGTGSNGSGTLTGFTSTRAIFTRGAAFGSTVTNYPTYICCVDGFLGMGWKLGGNGTNGMGMFGIGRPCNLDASLRSDAVQIYTMTGGGTSTSCGCEIVRFSDGVKFGAPAATGNITFTVVPFSITNSSVSAQFGAWSHKSSYPQTFGFLFFGTVVASEITINTQTAATFYGASSHNYVSFGSTMANFAANNSTNYCALMIWE